MPLRCIVIEDEPPAMDKIVNFIQKVDLLQLKQVFYTGIEALSYLSTTSTDLIFLDIQMEDFTGIQFLEVVKNLPQVIITSAYEQYALRGYEFEVTDYLLKPYTFERFLQAAGKAHSRISATSLAVETNTFFVKANHRLEKIKADDILYIEAKAEYLKIVTSSKSILTLQSFRGIEDALPDNLFIRVHRSYLVAIDKIDHIEGNSIKIKQQTIPIGDTFKEVFWQKISIIKK